jgi:hypothetical protein
MKCFIASAFGHKDVDAIYDHFVVPTLRKLSVTPLRVDRVKHNEDIDNKIFELLDSPDFAIAFARGPMATPCVTSALLIVRIWVAMN